MKKDELLKLEEEKNKQIINSMYILGTAITIFFLAFLFVVCYFVKNENTVGLIVVSSMIVFVAACFHLVKMEVEAGYYECKKCKHRYVPKYFDAVMAPHMMTTRYLRCPKCNEKSWSKKVMTKE